MDQFDDLPDFVEKDTKPKFQTEVSHNSNQNQQISNGLVPLFGDDQIQPEDKVDAGHEDPQDVDDNLIKKDEVDKH